MNANNLVGQNGTVIQVPFWLVLLVSGLLLLAGYGVYHALIGGN